MKDEIEMSDKVESKSTKLNDLINRLQPILDGVVNIENRTDDLLIGLNGATPEEKKESESPFAKGYLSKMDDLMSLLEAKIGNIQSMLTNLEDII